MNKLIIPDSRTDELGAVAVKFAGPDEFEAFIGTLNRGRLMLVDADGRPFTLRFLPHYFGEGHAAIEISQRYLDLEAPADVVLPEVLDG